MNNHFKQSDNLKKTIVLALGILVLISIGVWVWMWNGKKENMMRATDKSVVETQEQKKEDIVEVDTSDWLTYRNEEYGFEFRYPRGWEVKTKDNSDTFWKNSITNVPNYESFPYLIIDTTKKGPNFSIKNFIDPHGFLEEPGLKGFTNLKNLNFLGLNGYVYNQPGATLAERVYYIDWNDSIIVTMTFIFDYKDTIDNQTFLADSLVSTIL